MIRPKPSAPGVQSQSDAKCASPADIVGGFYRGFLGRDPDKAGLAHWAAVIESGVTIENVLQAILDSPEYVSQSVATRQAGHVERAVAEYARSFFVTSPIVIVDVGAQELRDEDHIYAAIGKHRIPQRIVGFEPLDERRAERAQHEDGQDIELLSTFIGDGGQHVFHINKPDSTSSLLPFNDKVIRGLVGLSCLTTEKTEVVTTRTLDESLADYSYIDFLKLDIQGFELPALLGSPDVLKRTQVIHCEVSFAEIYRGQSLFSEVEILLRGLGFSFIDFAFSCRYPYHNASGAETSDRLGWADAVFFRENSALVGGRDVLVQSVLALLIYGKVSLATSLAESYGTDFSGLFGA